MKISQARSRTGSVN